MFGFLFFLALFGVAFFYTGYHFGKKEVENNARDQRLENGE